MPFGSMPSTDSVFSSWLQGHRDELQAALTNLFCQSNAAQHAGSLTAQDVVARLWNAAADENALDDERKEALKTQLAWAKAAEQRQNEEGAHAKKIYDRYREARVLPDWFHRQSRSLAITRLERSLVGTSHNLLATLPSNMAAVGSAKLNINWNEDERGRVSWLDAADHHDIYYFVPTAQGAIELYGEVPSSVSAALAAQFATDLQNRQSILPHLQLTAESDTRYTVLLWNRPTVEPALHVVEPHQTLLARARTVLPTDVELAWWERFPEFAQRLDRALCRAMSEDAHQARVGDEPGKEFLHVTQLIDDLRGGLGRSRAEVLSLLAPFAAAHAPGETQADERHVFERLLMVLDFPLDDELS